MENKINNTEMKMLRDKCLLFNQFMIEKGGIPKGLIGVYLESNIIIEKAFKKGKLKPLQIMSQDIDNQILYHMPSSMAYEFKQLLLEKTGVDYEKIDNVLNIEVKKIINKGVIESDYEYDLIMNRVETIYNNSEYSEEVEKLNSMLVNYKNDAI